MTSRKVKARKKGGRKKRDKGRRRGGSLSAIEALRSMSSSLVFDSQGPEFAKREEVKGRGFLTVETSNMTPADFGTRPKARLD